MTLTITDPAYAHILDTVHRSSVANPVIRLDQISRHFSSDGLERMVQRGASERALQEMGFYEHRFELTPVRYRL